MSRKKQCIYWRPIIHEIETAVKRKARRERIKRYDYYPTLPKKLYQRVVKIIPVDYGDDSLSEGEAPPPIKPDITPDPSGESSESLVKKPEPVYNESTCSLIERKEKEFPVFDLNLEYAVEKKEVQKKRENWYTKYICAKRKDRIKWKSKIYHMEKNISEKPLDEQAEEIMDASAERFTEWMGTLGTRQETDMSKEQIKSLFSIEGNAKLLASIQTDPKEVKAIAKTVADRWNLPEMAIELKYENYVNQHLKSAPKHANTVAFGRTIPYKERPWTRDAEGVTIDTIFPDVLLSGEHLFKGIAHLRSTKALIEHCKKKPNIPRPRYLVENGYFKESTKTVSDTEIPLYELLKAK